MALTRRSSTSTKGLSLSRGPALMLGSVLLAAGLYFLYHAHTFPALSRFPHGHARIDGRAFFHVFGVNGWSAELTAVAGGVLLFCAAQHFLAKTASLLVAVVLAGLAIISLADHHTALGLFAVNIWTIVLWGGSAVLLLVNVLLPRPSLTDSGTAVAAAPVYAAAPSPETYLAPTRSTRVVEETPTAVLPGREEAPTAVLPTDEQAPTAVSHAAEPTMAPIRTEPVTGSSPSSVDVGQPDGD